MYLRRNSIIALSLLAAALTPGTVFASALVLNRDSVVPVVFDSALTISDSEVGDTFTCHVDSDRDLPTGTRLTGKIVSIRSPRGDRPASMDLEFTTIDLPNGPSARIHAVPIPLNKDIVRTDGSGRMYVKDDVRKQGEYVLGGAIGGYLLGSLFHRRITGLFLGTIVGAIAANSDRARSENVVVDKGSKLGALFNQDVTIDLSGSGQGGRGWDSTSRGGSGNPAATDQGNDGGRGWDSATNRPTPPGTVPPAPAGGNTPPPPPRSDVSIRFGDKSPVFDADATPYYEGEVVMVPIQKMADLLGLSFEKGDKDSVYVENQDNSMKLEKDSATYRLNGKRSNLSHPVVEKKGVLYAPVTIFAPLASKDLIVNGTKLDPKISD